MKTLCFRIFLISSFHLSVFYGSAQQLTVRVIDTENNLLPGAAVLLTSTGDSTTVHSISDLQGVATFNNILSGAYLMNVTYIGFNPVSQTIIVDDDNRRFDIMMSADAIALGGVTITAKKPLIRQEDDKMIIDPEPLANTSTNALEIIESTPGIYVDQDGGIFLTGATPATVYINGREQKMSTEDINTILRSLPPHSVEKIEIIRTPSSKYDASSSGGIINIVLKKGVKIGKFGSVSGGMNQGVYGNRFGGFTFNNSGDMYTGYINVNYNNDERLDEINSVRYLQNDTNLEQSSEDVRKRHQLYLGYGFTYDPGRKTSFSYDGRINGSLRNSESKNTNLITAPGEVILSESDNFTNNHVQFLNIQQDWGMIIKTDTSGSQIDTKLNYSFNTRGSDQEYLTEYVSPIDTAYATSGDNLQNRHFIVFQSDLTQQLPWKFKMEAGIKTSWQLYNSDAKYYLDNNGVQITDDSRTNAYTYTENINAFYVQASRPLFAGFQLKAGVRMEHTSMNGQQTVPADTSFLVNRADWFPYVYLSRKVLDLMGIELFGYAIYRRTISRPDYDDLNPYIRFIDQFMYETGNPSLKPQFTDNVELNVSFNDFPVFAVGQNVTTDIFSMVMYRDDDYPEVLVRTYDNVGTSREKYLRGMVGIPPGGIYFFALGAQYNMNEYDGMYENEPLTFTNNSWRFFTFHSLNITENTKFTVSGFMMKNGVWNFYELEDFGQINAGLTQTFLNKKLTVTLNARDIFKTNVNRFEFNQGSIRNTGDRYTDNRRFGINIRYNFGIRKKEIRKGMPEFEEPEF